MTFKDFATQDIKDIFQKLGTPETGLADKEAEARLEKFGPNQITQYRPKTWDIFLRQTKTPFIYLLLVASLIAFFVGEAIDGAVIFSFIIITVILGFIQEYQSEKSLELLRSYIKHPVRVRRQGKACLIDRRNLVPGDIVILEDGDVVGADLRLFKTQNFLVDESILTGESISVSKISSLIKIKNPEIYECSNIAFTGTTVVNGVAEGVVFATGKKAYLGNLSKLVAESQETSTFEKNLLRFSRFIIRMVVITITMIFVANLAIKGTSADPIPLLLFSIALTVSVIPEALPLVTTISFSRGALRLARQKVVVRRLSAIEDLGSIQVLCTDKTGTITQNRLTVKNINSFDKARCLVYALLTSSFVGEEKESTPLETRAAHEIQPHELSISLQTNRSKLRGMFLTGSNNSFDVALWQSADEKAKLEISQYKKLFKIPFDPSRRIDSALVTRAFDRFDKLTTGKLNPGGKENLLVVKGAPEVILENSSDKNKKRFEKWCHKEGQGGARVIGLGVRFWEDSQYTESDERDLDIIGFISFIDPLKTDAKSAIDLARKLGVEVKILTGDAPEVAGAVAKEIGLIKDSHEVINGVTLAAMAPVAFERAAKNFKVFARVTPEQKYQLIKSLQKHYEVGFLGEGMNDAPALKLANVALAVEGAADIAREASDIILLNKSLKVIIEGIKEGRNIFANVTKYIKTTLIANFGNFYSIAVISLIIPFLPMLPSQILLVNLLSDFPLIAVTTDAVESAELRRPRHYQINEIVLVAIILGLVSTVFDFIFFGIFKNTSPQTIQTLWFIESILTELLLIFSIRSRLFFLRAKRPSTTLLVLSILAVIVTIVLPFTNFGQEFFHFEHPNIDFLLIVFVLVILYFVITEVLKLFYYRSVKHAE